MILLSVRSVISTPANCVSVRLANNRESQWSWLTNASAERDQSERDATEILFNRTIKQVYVQTILPLV